MTQMITIILLLASFVLSFIFEPYWAWAPIAVIEFIIIISFWSSKIRYRFKNIEGLSSDANELLQSHGHYFAMPFASRDFSASAATIQFGSIILAIIGAFKGFWWAIGLAAVNWFVMGAIATALSPVSLLASSQAMQLAHDEIFEYLKSQRNMNN